VSLLSLGHPGIGRLPSQRRNSGHANTSRSGTGGDIRVGDLVRDQIDEDNRRLDQEYLSLGRCAHQLGETTLTLHAWTID
jgi:hypothetical protein